MNKRYIVRLTDEERGELQKLVSTGKAPAYKIKHANILLAVDADGPNWTDERTAKAFSCHVNTVANVRQRFVEQGLEAALNRKKRERAPRLVDDEVEAKISNYSATKWRLSWPRMYNILCSDGPGSALVPTFSACFLAKAYYI